MKKLGSHHLRLAQWWVEEPINWHPMTRGDQLRLTEWRNQDTINWAFCNDEMSWHLLNDEWRSQSTDTQWWEETINWDLLNEEIRTPLTELFSMMRWADTCSMIEWRSQSPDTQWWEETINWDLLNEEIRTPLTELFSMTRWDETLKWKLFNDENEETINWDTGRVLRHKYHWHGEQIYNCLIPCFSPTLNPLQATPLCPNGTDWQALMRRTWINHNTKSPIQPSDTLTDALRRTPRNHTTTSMNLWGKRDIEKTRPITILFYHWTFSSRLLRTPKRLPRKALLCLIKWLKLTRMPR